MMLKSLLKKQFLENMAFLFYNKQGKRRSVGNMLVFGGLMLFVVASFFSLFYQTAVMICSPLVEQGLGWVYFAIFGTMATVLGVVGSIFATKTKLYEAKDNDLLFSMPIPAWLVICVRILGLYLFTLGFEALIFVPAVAAYLVQVGFSVIVLGYCILTLLIMPLGALVVCLVLGWVLAFLAAKLPAKNVTTVLATVLFLVLYFLAYSKMNDFLTYVLTNGGEVAGKMQVWLFPFWKMGLGCEGDILGFLWYVLIFVGSFAVVYFVISKTYLRLATANRGGRKSVYRSKERKQTSWFFALLKKERMRFTKNPMVAMNCCLGTLMLFILPFVVLFSGELRQALALMQGEVFAMVAALILSTVCSTNTLSAASVSLEGESLWIVRSLPVPTEKILTVKGVFHFLMTGIPALFACVFLSILLKIGMGYAALLTVFTLVFSAFSAVFGLFINLKMPNLHWTNEIVVVKQSIAVSTYIFAEWGVLGLLVGGYFLFGKYLLGSGYFFVCIFAVALVSALLVAWLSLRGKKIFEEL